MSLEPAHRALTSQELRAAFRLTGLTPEQVEQDLGLGAAELDATFDLAPEADPAAVWALRDYLDRALEQSGGAPQPYTYLTEDLREEGRNREAPGVPAVTQRRRRPGCRRASSSTDSAR